MRGLRPAALPILALLALALLAGCLGAEPVAPPDPAARARMLLNAGNQAFHAGDYKLAARRYAAAAVVKKDDPVAYFGLGMALTRLGRDEDARAAYAKSRELNQQRNR